MGSTSWLSPGEFGRWACRHCRAAPPPSPTPPALMLCRCGPSTFPAAAWGPARPTAPALAMPIFVKRCVMASMSARMAVGRGEKKAPRRASSQPSMHAAPSPAVLRVRPSQVRQPLPGLHLQVGAF